MSGPDRPEYQWGNEGQSDQTQAFPTPPPPPAQQGGYTPQPWSQQPSSPGQGGWGPQSNPSTPAWGIPGQQQPAQPTWQQPPPPPNTGQQWGPPVQNWQQPGQPDYGQYGQPPAGKSKTPLIIGLVAAVVVILALIAGAYFMFFRAKVLDQAAVQKGVQSVLTDSYDLQNVTNVKCPKDEKVEVNSSFTCNVTVDGESRTVTIKIIDEDGTYEVSKPQ